MSGGGTGSPNWFRCHEERSTIRGGRHEDHVVTLTGRQRKARFKRGPGTRSTDREREYRCSCGHVGWSNHMDLARMAGEPLHVDHPEWG